MIAALWLALALAAPCELDAPPDAPFQVTAPEAATHARLVIELWPDLTDVAWLDAQLAVLEARGRVGAVILPLPGRSGTDPALLALATRAASAGHEVGVVFGEDDVPLDALAGPREVKRRLAELRKAAGGIHTAAAPLPNRTAEALLGGAGLRTLMQVRGPATAIPRVAVVFEGKPRIGAVLQAGPYAGPCGVRPFASPLTPPAADRATQALWGAARIEGVPVVRVAVRPGADAATDALVLGRWIDEVLVPGGIVITTPDRARLEVLAYFRTGRIMEPSALDAGGGRLVSLDEVRAAAQALDNENLLPRRLPGDLNLTEAFLAFALLLAGQNEGEVVRLTALRGPETRASSGVEGIVELDPAAVTEVCVALLAALPEAIPSSMPVGGQLIGAPELLTAMAATLRGKAQTWPTASPDPNAPGQGWGVSTLP